MKVHKVGNMSDSESSDLPTVSKAAPWRHRPYGQQAQLRYGPSAATRERQAATMESHMELLQGTATSSSNTQEAVAAKTPAPMTAESTTQTEVGQDHIGTGKFRCKRTGAMRKKWKRQDLMREAAQVGEGKEGGAAEAG
eukprot:GEMP01070732.1.p1 GENE.GEMP01070732.1~~GEMP01070732.1.p1  ORF type:complete len:139 (+),score=29.95 GEMP01070732.1:35-451(+)